MNTRKNTTFNITINSGDYSDSLLMSRAFFNENERAQMKSGGIAPPFTIAHEDEQYQCCSTYTSTSPFIVFAITDGDEPHIFTRNRKVEDRIKRLEADAAEKKSNEDQTIIIVISLHEGNQLTEEQEARIENARAKYGAHLYRLTDSRIYGQPIKDLAEVETNKPMLEEIREQMLAKMVGTTHSIKTVKEMERARIEEEKRQAEEDKRLAEEARIKKEKEDREAAEAAAIKRKEEEAAHKLEKSKEWQTKVKNSPFKENEGSLYVLLQEAKLEQDSLILSKQEFMIYLLERPKKWNEFRELMQNKPGIIRLYQSQFENLNRIILEVGAEKLDEFCETYELTLDHINELKIKDLDQLTLRHFEKYPLLMGWIAKNSRSLGDVHDKIISLDYTKPDHKITIPDSPHAMFLEALLASNLANGRDILKVLNDIKNLSAKDAVHFNNMLAKSTVSEAMAYIADSIKEDGKYAELMKIADYCKAKVDLESKINELNVYGQSLKTEGREAAGQNCIDVAEHLKTQVNDYLSPNSDKSALSLTINQTLTKGVSTLRSDRRAMDIVAHIAICLTVIGLVILGIRAAFTHTFFVNSTKRENMLEDVNRAWNKLGG